MVSDFIINTKWFGMVGSLCFQLYHILFLFLLFAGPNRVDGPCWPNLKCDKNVTVPLGSVVNLTCKYNSSGLPNPNGRMWLNYTYSGSNGSLSLKYENHTYINVTCSGGFDQDHGPLVCLTWTSNSTYF